jgi:hypothetical protein
MHRRRMNFSGVEFFISLARTPTEAERDGEVPQGKEREALFSSHNFIMSCANYLKVARHCKI